DEPEREADRLAGHPGADDQPAGMHRGAHRARRHDLQVVDAPYPSLQVLERTQLLHRLELFEFDVDRSVTLFVLTAPHRGLFPPYLGPVPFRVGPPARPARVTAGGLAGPQLVRCTHPAQDSGALAQGGLDVRGEGRGFVLPLQGAVLPVQRAPPPAGERISAAGPRVTGR